MRLQSTMWPDMSDAQQRVERRRAAQAIAALTSRPLELRLERIFTVPRVCLGGRPFSMRHRCTARSNCGGCGWTHRRRAARGYK